MSGASPRSLLECDFGKIYQPLIWESFRTRYRSSDHPDRADHNAIRVPLFAVLIPILYLAVASAPFQSTASCFDANIMRCVYVGSWVRLRIQYALGKAARIPELAYVNFQFPTHMDGSATYGPSSQMEREYCPWRCERR